MVSSLGTKSCLRSHSTLISSQALLLSSHWFPNLDVDQNHLAGGMGGRRYMYALELIRFSVQ